MSEQFQVVDTTQIQLDSLVAVMDTLGYRIDRAGAEGDKRKPTGGFITDNRQLAANRNLGLSTAVKIHNAHDGLWIPVAPGWYRLDVPGVQIVVSAYALAVLRARKLVEKVKFQKNRKSPWHVVVTDHMVKPVKEEYVALLGLAA